MSLSDNNNGDTVTRLRCGGELVPPKQWMPRVFLYSDDIVSAAVAGPAFSPKDCIVVQGAERGWIIDAESGIMLSDRKEDAAGVHTVGMVKQTADGPPS